MFLSPIVIGMNFFYNLYFWIIVTLIIYIIVHQVFNYNTNCEEGFTPTIRRSYNSNARFMRNSLYSNYKKAVHNATSVLKFLRIY